MYSTICNAVEDKMRGIKALPACWRGLAVAMIFATTDPANASFVFVEGFAQTSTGGTTHPSNEFIPFSGSNSAGKGSSFGPASTFSSGGANSSSAWHVGATANVTGSDDYRGPFAASSVEVVITDHITPSVEGHLPGHGISLTGHFSISGEVSGHAEGPGWFAASVAAKVDVRDDFGDSTRFYGEEDLTSGIGYGSTMPRGDQTWFASVITGESYTQTITLDAFVEAYTIENQGSAQATSDFSHTFQWGGVTDIFDETTGQPIAAEDFHLIGDDGFDWAHPLAVPEPATLGIAIVAAALILSSPRKRIA